MRETIEFRIAEDDARRYLNPEDGEVIGQFGGVRKLLLDSNDIRVARVGKIHRELWAQGSIFCTSWEVRRKYTKKELETAELFQLCIRSAFEPEGESCGTKYDDTVGCPHCGFGRVSSTNYGSTRVPSHAAGTSRGPSLTTRSSSRREL